MYAFLDTLFLIFHSSLIVFSLVGWIWKKTRRAHFLVLSLTMSSWFVLGIWYGFGYCPCTDWHWRVKRELGETTLPISYVKYYADRLTGVEWNSLVLDLSVAVLGLATFGVSIWLNFRDWRRGHCSNSRTSESV